MGKIDGDLSATNHLDLILQLLDQKESLCALLFPRPSRRLNAGAEVKASVKAGSVGLCALLGKGRRPTERFKDSPSTSVGICHETDQLAARLNAHGVVCNNKIQQCHSFTT